MIRLGILISGRGSNMKAILKQCRAHVLAAEVVCVISNKEDAAGLAYARSHDVPTAFINPKEFENATAYENEIISQLKNHNVDWLILAGYMKIIGDSLLHAYAHKILNIHPSLLPAFKGLHAQRQALDYGVKIAGCTVHFVTKELDSGAIIAQSSVPVESDDTEDTLSARILEAEHHLYPKVIGQIANNLVTFQDNKVTIKP